MKITILFLIMTAVGLVALLAHACYAAGQSWRRRQYRAFSNIATGVHKNAVTRNADAVLAFSDTGPDVAGYLVKEGTTPGVTVAIIAAASDEPAFIALDGADAIGDPVVCGLLGATNLTRPMVATGANAVGAPAYSYGDGTVGAAPTVAGTYWYIGTFKTASAATGDVVEIETVKPVKVVWLAKFTCIATAAASDLGTSETLANALKADLTALNGALAARAFVIMGQ